MHKPTKLCTDASRHGLGFILQQKNPDGKWNLIQAGSRFLSDTESRYASQYAIIELEMLVVCWAIQRCHLFLAGLQHFQVVTDHNPPVREVEHGNFSPLVFSTSGGMGASTTVAYKRLAFLLSCKWKSPYCRVMSWLRCCLGFSLLHSAIMCIRGSRSSSGHPFKDHVPASVDLALGEGRLGAV